MDCKFCKTTWSDRLLQLAAILIALTVVAFFLNLIFG